MIRGLQRLNRVPHFTPQRLSVHKYPQIIHRTISSTMAESIVPKKIENISGPLVWVDCEMTGLNHRKDQILEIAVVITDGDLNAVDDGIQYIIKTDKDVLDSMGEWCVKQHGASGLTEACLNSPHSLSFVSDAILNYIKKHIPRQGMGVLAGNSVHTDRIFMVESMPKVVNWLHYRIVDVSSIKELCRRWYPDIAAPKTENVDDAHRALADIRRSIEELRWYRENVFIVPKGLT